MKQEILCLKCAKESRDMFPTESPYPGEHVKFVSGTAVKDMFCDGCSPLRPIAKGEKCVAFSIWADHGRIPYYPWEAEFILIEAET